MSSKCPVRELNWLELRQPSMANPGLPVAGGRGVEQSAPIFVVARLQQAMEQRLEEWKRRGKLIRDTRSSFYNRDTQERVLAMGTPGGLQIAVIEPNSHR